MLMAVVHKELILHLVSFRFLSSSLLFVVLATLATLAGTLDYELRLDAYATQEERYRLELSKVSVYSFLQPVALLSPEPLSILDRGFEGRLGNEVAINIYSIPAKAAGEFRGNPYLASFRGIDLTTIVQVVLGLQALLLTFDGIVGERERKTLALVLAHDIARSSVLFGKFLGALTALLIPLTISCLLSVGLLVGPGGIEPTAGQWWRLGSLFCVYGAYLAIMLLLGLLLSLAAPSAPKSLAYAILTWLGLVFLLPQSAVLAANAFFGSRSDELAVESEIGRLEQGLENRLREAWQKDPLRVRRTGHFASVTRTHWNRAVLRRFGSARYYDSLARYYREETSLGMRHAERVFELLRAYERREKMPAHVARLLTALSPAAALEELAESLTGTSVAEHDAFLAACRTYREELIEYLHRKRAFDSWRWFTDDPPETHPWPTLLGLKPDDVDASNIMETFTRLLDPEIQAKRRRTLADTRAARQLDLGDLPEFRFRASDLFPAIPRVALELILFVAMGTLVTWGTVQRFAHYEVE